GGVEALDALGDRGAQLLGERLLGVDAPRRSEGVEAPGGGRRIGGQGGRGGPRGSALERVGLDGGEGLAEAAARERGAGDAGDVEGVDVFSDDVLVDAARELLLEGARLRVVGAGGDGDGGDDVVLEAQLDGDGFLAGGGDVVALGGVAAVGVGGGGVDDGVGGVARAAGEGEEADAGGAEGGEACGDGGHVVQDVSPSFVAAGSGPDREGNDWVKPLRVFCSYALLTNMLAPDAHRSAVRALRPSAKVLPEHARGHNRSLVLQTLYRGGLRSRADLARETGLTRVTISDLVAELIADGLVDETGQRDEGRPGKPAILLDLNRDGYRIIGADLSDTGVFRAAVLDIDGNILTHREVATDGASGAEVTAIVLQLVAELITAAEKPILGIGIGSPGIVDLAGTVLSAPNLGWIELALQEILETATRLPVFVANDANAAALAEYSFGEAHGDVMLIRVGRGVGAGLILGGRPVHGSRFAAGE